MSRKSGKTEAGHGTKREHKQDNPEDNKRDIVQTNVDTARIMIDHMFQFVAVLTSDGTLIDVNRAALDSVGAAKSDVIGKPFWETPWWKHSPEIQQKLKDAIKTAATGKFMRFEVTHPTLDGDIIYGDFSLNPVKDDNGQVIYLIPESRNITERKKVEEALRNSERTAVALLNAPTESALLIDSNFAVLAINEEAARRFKKSPKELIGKNIFDLLPRELTTYRKQKVLEAIETKRQVRFEDNYKGRYYDHNIFPVLDDEGNVTQIAIYSSDITDYKRAQIRIQERTEALIESEEKYRTLVENVPLVVYRLGQNGNLIFVNEFVEEISGYTPVDFFKDPKLWIKRMHEDDRGWVNELKKKSFQKGKEVVVEYRIRHKKGHLVYVMDHAIPFRSSKNITTSVDGIIMDVTDRVKLQEQLVQAEGLKTVAEISARLAHEIRNPLMSAGGFARRLLRSMSPSDPNRNKVEIIIQEIGRLESILRMILSYMHPRALDMAPADPNQLVRDTIDTMKKSGMEKDIKIVSKLTPGLPMVSIDYSQLKEGLITLFQNAIYQMEKGATLSVSTCREGKNFKFTISYPAKNIPIDDIKACFYPFTTSPMILDTVDLSIAKALINKHGGTIKADFNKSKNMIEYEISLPFIEDNEA